MMKQGRGKLDRSGIANATVTVTFPTKRGRGVLVPGNLILTAAHCIECNCSGEMGVELPVYIGGIQTALGDALKVRPLAVDPVADIAVLGALDDQAVEHEADRFDRFCDKTKAVRVCKDDQELFQEFTVHIYTHTATWIEGTAWVAERDSGQLTLTLKAGNIIEAGTSGSPIVNERGELVGIVSSGTGRPVAAARLLADLPLWVHAKIFDKWSVRDRRALRKLQRKRERTKNISRALPPKEP